MLQWEKKHPIPDGFIKCNPQDKPKSGDIICFYNYPSHKKFIKDNKYVFSDTVFDVEAELVFKVFYSAFGKMCYRRCNEKGERDKNDWRQYGGGMEYPGGFQPNWYVKTKSAKKTATNTAAPVAVGTSDLQIVDYSDKAIVLTGDTKPFKDQIKSLGGKFGSRFDKSKVPSGIGWLFPKTKLAAVQEFVSKYGKKADTAISPLLLAELELVKLHNGNGGGLRGTKENLIQNFQQNIWKNGFNSVTLNQLDFLINDIQNGHIQSNIGRLNRYGRPCNYYIAVRAAIITRGEIGADKTKLGNKRNAQTWDRKSRIRRQTELLTEFATLSGCWLNDFSEQPGNVVYLNGKKYEYLAEGAENRVYDSGDKDEQRKVIKVIDIPTDWEHIFYDDVAEIFERILIHNCLFQNAVLNIVGFAYDGVFKIVLEQFYFKGVPPSDSEFDEFIKQRVGALKKVMDFYINDDFYLGDFHDKNVIKDKNGNIIVIDDMLAFNHGDFKGLKGFDIDWLYEDFKVGDKVVYIGKDYGNDYTTKGTIGTIVKIHKSRKASILTKYDLQIDGYGKVCGFENFDLRKLKLLESEAKLAKLF